MFSIVTTWYMTSLIAIRLCIKLTFSVTPNICSSGTRCKYGYCKTSNLAIDPLDQNQCLVTFNYLCWFHNVKEPLSLMRNHVRTVQIAVIVTPMFVFNYAYSSVRHLNSSFLSSSLRTNMFHINKENWLERRKIRHSFDPRIQNGQLLEDSGNLECFLTRTSQNLRCMRFKQNDRNNKSFSNIGGNYFHYQELDHLICTLLHYTETNHYWDLGQSDDQFSTLLSST